MARSRARQGQTEKQTAPGAGTRTSEQLFLAERASSSVAFMSSILRLKSPTAKPPSGPSGAFMASSSPAICSAAMTAMRSLLETLPVPWMRSMSWSTWRTAATSVGFPRTSTPGNSRAPIWLRLRVPSVLLPSRRARQAGQHGVDTLARGHGRDAQALQFGVTVLQVALQFRFAGREALRAPGARTFRRPAVRVGRFPRAGPRPASRNFSVVVLQLGLQGNDSASRSAARCLSARCSASASFRRRRSASRSECRCRVRCTSCPIRAASWSRSCSMGAIVNHPG